ncbi:MAG TPA: hypothetical protein DDY21_01360 [Candidatus Moranbacteria bacterium]|nr:hypothetical protein [Candidatus Moranbacteria bacterium]
MHWKLGIDLKFEIFNLKLLQPYVLRYRKFYCSFAGSAEEFLLFSVCFGVEDIPSYLFVGFVY